MTVEVRRMAFDAAEFRAEGRRLSGIVMPYESTSMTTPAGPERFQSGAFEGRAGDVVLNLHHAADKPLVRTDAGLVLEHTAEALRMTAELPSTRDADDALELVRTKVLRGLSVEFVARIERREQGVRVVEQAELSGIGLVTRPAYKDAEVAARAAAPPSEIPWWLF